MGGGNRGSARERLLAAALDQLVTGGIPALRSVVSPSYLLRAVTSAKRDSTYRILRDTAGTLTALSERINDLRWSGAEATAHEVVHAYLRTSDSPRERLINAMAANITGSFDSNGWPAGYLLLAAAMSASPRWSGPTPTDPADIDLGRQVLEDRREYYRKLGETYEPLLLAAMSDLGLRPDGRTIRQVVRLMHCLMDGAVLRMFFDPDLDVDDVAEAMFRFGVALGKPGALIDDRRPTDTGRAEVFDAVIDAATEWWTEHPQSTAPDIDTIACHAHVADQTLRMLLPSDCDLADSVLRSRLVDAGLGGGAAEPDLNVFGVARLITGLHRIAAVADTFPGPKLLIEQVPVLATTIREDSLYLVQDVTSDIDGLPCTPEELHNAAWGGAAALSSFSAALAYLADQLPTSERI